MRIQGVSRAVFFLILVGLGFAAPGKAVPRSLLVPGWGERGLGFHSRANLFHAVELGLWTLAGATYLNANHADEDIRFLAARYAGVEKVDGKSDSYLDQLASYDNLGEYNATMLRNRQPEKLLSAEAGMAWDWVDAEQRQRFKDRKLERYRWRQSFTYTLGAVALNHLISAMDALVLERNQTHLSLHSTASKDGLVLEIQRKF